MAATIEASIVAVGLFPIGSGRPLYAELSAALARLNAPSNRDLAT
jgi:hypothetical protein